MLLIETASKSHQTQNTDLFDVKVVLCFKGLGKHEARKCSVYCELRILFLCDATVKVYALLPICRRFLSPSSSQSNRLMITVDTLLIVQVHKAVGNAPFHSSSECKWKER
jgi:hypothetical protein